MKRFVAALVIFLTAFGSANAISLFGSRRASEFTATLTTTDNTATDLFDVATDTNTVYFIEVDSLARGVAGSDQGKVKAQKCFVGSQNIAGTVTNGTLICQTGSGPLTATGLAVTTDGTSVRFTVQGAASQHISWVAKVKVRKSEEVNVTTTSSSTTSSTSTSSTSTSSSTSSSSTSTSTSSTTSST